MVNAFLCVAKASVDVVVVDLVVLADFLASFSSEKFPDDEGDSNAPALDASLAAACVLCLLNTSVDDASHDYLSLVNMQTWHPVLPSREPYST